jgi:hypothetical protein
MTRSYSINIGDNNSIVINNYISDAQPRTEGAVTRSQTRQARRAQPETEVRDTRSYSRQTGSAQPRTEGAVTRTHDTDDIYEELIDICYDFCDGTINLSYEKPKETRKAFRAFFINDDRKTYNLSSFNAFYTQFMRRYNQSRKTDGTRRCIKYNELRERLKCELLARGYSEDELADLKKLP